MREWQRMGLSEWAGDYINSFREEAEVNGTIMYKDGRTEPYHKTVLTAFTLQVEEYTTHCGWYYGEELPLHKYTTKTGEVFYEYVQAEPWNGGPVTFLALCRKNPKETKPEFIDPIPESLWGNEEIENA